MCVWGGGWGGGCHVTDACVVSVAASLAPGAPHSGEGGAGQDAQGEPRYHPRHESFTALSPRLHRTFTALALHFHRTVTARSQHHCRLFKTVVSPAVSRAVSQPQFHNRSFTPVSHYHSIWSFDQRAPFETGPYASTPEKDKGRYGGMRAGLYARSLTVCS